MSKKETEFDRYARMRKMQRDSEMQRRKEFDETEETRKGGKSKQSTAQTRKRLRDEDMNN